jgi:hypothetical protein
MKSSFIVSVVQALGPTQGPVNHDRASNRKAGSEVVRDSTEMFWEYLPTVCTALELPVHFFPSLLLCSCIVDYSVSRWRKHITYYVSLLSTNRRGSRVASTHSSIYISLIVVSRSLLYGALMFFSSDQSTVFVDVRVSVVLLFSPCFWYSFWIYCVQGPVIDRVHALLKHFMQNQKNFRKGRATYEIVAFELAVVWTNISSVWNCRFFMLLCTPVERCIVWFWC